MLPSVQQLYPGGFRFLQDNDPAHSEKDSINLLQSLVPRVEKLPAQSADFNVIEHVWSLMDTRVAAHHAKTTAGLKQAITEEWGKITVDECQHIIDSLHGTLRAVVAAGGEHVSAAERRRYRA